MPSSPRYFAQAVCALLTDLASAPSSAVQSSGGGTSSALRFCFRPSRRIATAIKGKLPLTNSCIAGLRRLLIIGNFMGPEVSSTYSHTDIPVVAAFNGHTSNSSMGPGLSSPAGALSRLKPSTGDPAAWSKVAHSAFTVRPSSGRLSKASGATLVEFAEFTDEPQEGNWIWRPLRMRPPRLPMSRNGQ